LVHAIPEPGAIIGPQAEHTQGADPMKDSATRRKPFRKTVLASACLLSLIALGTTAQTPLSWNRDAPRATDVTVAPAPAPAIPSGKPAPLPAQLHRMPLASGFDVRVFEA